MKHALLILIPAIAFLYYPMAHEEFETPKVYALVAFACTTVFFVPWRTLIKDRVAWALGLFAVSAAASTVTSIDWHMSLFGNPKCPMGLLVIASYLVVYAVAAIALKMRANAEELVSVLLACSFVVAVYGIAQAFGFDFRTWNGTLHDGPYTRPMSTLGHPNFMANYLGMILPFALYRMEQEARRWRISAYGVLATLSVGAVFMSLSRGMIIATAVGAVSYFVMSNRRYKQAFVFMTMCAAVAALAFFTIPKFRRDATTRMQALLSPGPARVEYPTAAVRMWKLCPWLGLGTDTYEIGFRNQRTERYWQIERAGSPHRAHNDLLNILATQGLFGAMAAILVTMAVIARARRATSQLSIAATSSIIVYYVAGITSFTIVATGVLFLLCTAILKEGNET